MRLGQLVRGITLTLTAVVLVVSGAYLLIYLYRWEWNRALISGVFLLTALVTLSTVIILRALHRVSDRIDQLERSQRRAVARTLHEANARHASRHFRWLQEPPDRLGVFVPILLGAGALLSGLAYVIERAAGATVGRTVDARTSHLLVPDLPLGDGPAPVPTSTLPVAASTPVRHPVLRWAVPVVGVGAVVGAVFILREATQARVEAHDLSATTTVVLDVDQKGPRQHRVDVAAALWVACRVRLPGQTGLTALTATGDDEVRMVVDRGMGPLQRRRFFGCLEDATLPLVDARVKAFTVQKR